MTVWSPSICATCGYDRGLGLTGDATSLCAECRARHELQGTIDDLRRNLVANARQHRVELDVERRRADKAEAELDELAILFNRATVANAEVGEVLIRIGKKSPEDPYR